MIGIFGVLVIQVISILLWALFLNAPILQWRAQKLKNWRIDYKNSFFVSIRAGLVAMIVVNVGIFFGALSGNPTLATVGILFGFPLGLVSWWIVHSNAILKLAGSSSTFTLKDARIISSHVLGYLLAVSVAIILVIKLVKS